MANLQSNKITLTKIVNGQNGQDGAPGAPGSNGYNQATIYLYARTDSTPLSPTNNLIYTFSTGTLNNVPNPWSQVFPVDNGNPCYIAYAVAVSNENTDIIEPEDWTVQKLVEDGQNGQDGQNGINGFNQATIYLYQRAMSTPDAPIGLTYTFSTGSISGNLGNWERAIPVGTNPCYVTSAVVISRIDNENLLNFATPTILVENGQDASQYQIHTNYQRLLKYYEFNNNIQSLYIDSPLTFMVYNLQEDEYQDLSKATTINIEIENYSLAEYFLQSYLQTILIPVENTITKYNFKIFDLYQDLQDDDFRNNLKPNIDQNAFIQFLEDFFENSGGDIRIFIQSDQYSVEKFIELKNGLSNEMLDFSVNARDIKAAVDNSTLSFSANGLIVQNGGLQIIETQEDSSEILLSYDNQGGLFIKGSGSFTGNIEAQSGSFKGNIQAEEGIIGGFNISPYSLTSVFLNEKGKPYIQLIGEDYIKTEDLNPQNGKIYYYKNEEGKYQIFSGSSSFDTNVEYFEQNGGKIIAQNIELGTGAEITDFLKLGQAYIYNPKTHNNLFITAGSDNINTAPLQIQDKGVIKLGNITLDGINSSITIFDNNLEDDIIPNITVGNNIKITPNRSVFSEVDVQGTLSTTVFEVGKLQTAGGAMMFKEGAEINIQENSTSNFTIKGNTFDLEVGSIVSFSKDQGVVYGKIIDKTDDNIYTTDIDITNCINVVQLADPDPDKEGKYINNLVIGINSSSHNATILPPKALSMIEITGYNPQNNSLIYKGIPNLVLGDLNNLTSSFSNITGYGLYGDNVFLTGSLVTKVAENSYAGVNTLNGVVANKFNTSDRSKIVFWAGAKDNSYAKIQDAYFQVTENGSIYAGKGIFEGAIISNSYIQAAELYAISIFGGSNTSGGEAALKIYDTNKGIEFYSSRNSTFKQLQINNNGLSSNNQNFVVIKHNQISEDPLEYATQVNFQGREFEGFKFITKNEDGQEGFFNGTLLTKSNNGKILRILENSILASQYNNANEEIIQKGKIILDGDKVQLMSESNKIEVISDRINQFSSEMYILSEEIKYKKKTEIVNNIETIIGYDIYIS